MGAQESIGTILRAAATLPATYDAAGYGALTPTAVGEITEIPTFGGQAETITHTPLATGITEKFQGAINYGSLTVPLAFDRDDAGQVILKAAFASKARIAFEVEYPDGSFDYFSGKVMSEIRRGSTVSGVLGGDVMIEIETPLVEVAAT